MIHRQIALSMLFFASAFLSGNTLHAQNVAINGDGSSADASALLDVKSTTKGMLVPRMTASERGMIASPATGLIVYQTDSPAGFYYNAGTSGSPSWVLLIDGPIQGSDIASGTQTTTNTNLALGNDNNSAGELRLLEPSGSGSNFSAFKAQAQAGDVTYTLPAAAPTANGQILSSTTGGLMSWATAGGTVSTNSTLLGDGSAGNLLRINLGNSNTWTANQTFGGTFLITSNSNIAMTNSDNASRELRIQEPSGTGSQYIGIRCPTVSQNGKYTFPAVVGTVGQALKIASVAMTGLGDEANLVWGDAGGASVRSRAYRNATQNIPVSNTNPPTFTTILFNTEDYDTGSEFNSGAGTFTAATSGYYMISSSVSYVAGGTLSTKLMRILINGSPAAYGSSSPNTNANHTTSISTVLQLSTGDVISLQAGGFGGTAGAVDVAGTSAESFVQITKLQ